MSNASPMNVGDICVLNGMHDERVGSVQEGINRLMDRSIANEANPDDYPGDLRAQAHGGFVVQIVAVVRPKVEVVVEK